jgi:hypothetical protein
MESIEAYKQIEFTPNIPLKQITINEVLKEWKKIY